MAQEESYRVADPRANRGSWRLTFRFDGSRITLLDRVRVRKLSPGTTSQKPEPGRNSGAWLELVDSNDRVLFHRLLHDPLQTTAEHHSPDGRIEHHVRPPEPCTFTAIVPDVPGADAVILYASPAEESRMLDAAEMLGRFSLGDDTPDYTHEGGKP